MKLIRSNTVFACSASLALVLGCSGDSDDASPDEEGADIIDGFDDLTGMPDLTISRKNLEDSIKSESRRAGFMIKDFNKDDCAVLEGMIDPKEFNKQFAEGGPDPGRRFLMRFDSVTPNVGNTKLELGDPTAGVSAANFEPLEGAVDQAGRPLFKFSSCHRHMHFLGYAHYELLDAETKQPMFVKDEHDERGQVTDDADLDPQTDFEMDDEFKTFLVDENGKKIRKRLGVGLKRAFCLEDFGHMGSTPPTQFDAVALNVKAHLDAADLEWGGPEPKARKRLTAKEVTEIRRMADEQMEVMRAFAQGGQAAVDEIIDGMLEKLGPNAKDEDVKLIEKLRKGPHLAHLCDFQGIRPGLIDSYTAHLAGQWIDVTNVKPGKYIFRVTVNPNKMTEVRIPKVKDGQPVPVLDENGKPRLLLDANGKTIKGKDGKPLIKVQRRRVRFETNFDNNVAEVEVTIPPKVVADSEEITDEAFRPDIFFGVPDDA